MTLIQLAMRTSSVLVNNYSQTAFLKRFGVEYLPMVFLVESILTFLVINLVGVLMTRFRTLAVFTGLLLFFALSVAILRALIPLDIPLLYPILFILKSQAIETLPILYWDLVNDLFTTRQSKRLFTLITAGGILGTTLGSLMTGRLAKWIGMDNVLWAFVVGMTIAAFLNSMTERVTGITLGSEPRRKGRDRPNLRAVLKDSIAFARESPFLKYMVILVGIPNFVLPFLTYQFNVVVDLTYGTEQDTLDFLGVFRGLSSGLIFLTLLFSGRVLARWGIPNSLLIHPANYLIAFGVLFFKFDILSAVYARFTTELFKTTLNNPARAILYNFFPQRMRGLVRIFLRGTVVRIADLAGSGSLILIKGLLQPQMLSLVAAPLVGMWLVAAFLIRRDYSRMIIRVLLERHIDWERLQGLDPRALAKDQRAILTLRHWLREGDDQVATLCAEILGFIKPQGWISWVAETIPGRSYEAKERLMDMIIRDPGEPGVLEVLFSMAGDEDPEVLAVVAKGLRHVDPVAAASFFTRWSSHEDPRVRIQAIAGILEGKAGETRKHYVELVRSWLASGEPHQIREALEVLSLSAEPSLSSYVRRWAQAGDPRLRALALKALSKSCSDELLYLAYGAMKDPNAEVRVAAAEMIASCGPKVPLSRILVLLGDENPVVRTIARRAARQRPDAAKEVIGLLGHPLRRVRDEALTILEELDAGSFEVSQFFTTELRRSYKLLARSLVILRDGGASEAAQLLGQHLRESSELIKATALRILAMQSPEHGMKTLLRALESKEKRDIDDAVEALEGIVSPAVRKVLVPLLEPVSAEEKIQRGQRFFKGDLGLSQSLESVLRALLQDDDPVTVALALYTSVDTSMRLDLEGLALSPNARSGPAVEEALRELRGSYQRGHGLATKGLNLVQKACLIRKVPIFSGLLVRDLVALALLAVEQRCVAGQAVVREGEFGDSLYVVAHGDFRVIKASSTGALIPLDWIRPGGFFGEMALFDRAPRSATVMAESEGTVLRIDGSLFRELMEEVPSIPISACTELSRRIRTAHEILLAQNSQLDARM